MFFLFLTLLSCIPLCIGITILVLFKKNNLSKIIFIFTLLASFWQLDVAFLHAYDLLKEETIEFYFKLFRFGSIMITPTLFYVAYTIVQEILSNDLKRKWRFLVNRTTVLLFYAIAILVYITGWSDKGVSGLEPIQNGSNIFYFPVYGELSWFYHSNVLLFIFSMIICFLISLHVQDKNVRSFLVYFNIFTSIAFVIGTLNMFPSTRLYPSSIAILVSAISLLILSSRMYLEVVNNMNKKLSEQKNFLFQVIDLNPNYIYALDENGRYTLVNESYAQLMGMKIQDMIGKTDYDIQQDTSVVKQNVNQEKVIRKTTEKLFMKEEAVTAESGDVIWLETVKIPININDSSALLAVSMDITERKQYEDEIKFQANHDILTGLPNRRMFNEDLTNFLEKAKIEDSKNAIMFIDLDRFKYINDTLGHDVGDLLLVEVTKRLERLLKKEHSSAKIYRLGGDEFTILLPHHNEMDSETFAKELLEQFKNGFWIDGNDYVITPSIGISVFPNDGDDANTLIKHADTAMYYVKDRGKNNFQLFTSEMHQEFYRKMMIEKQLRTALDNDEFELYYQPIMDLKTNEIVGMESLIRWHNEILGQVAPDEFISIAEETGMIIPIGHWVLNTALEQNIRWQKAGYKPLKVSVNVSVKQLLDSTFLEKVKNALENTKLDATYIMLEITESIAMYAEAMIEKLDALKELGISLSMDDFGTGYSSLSYLNKYPLDSLKIDKSFVICMNKDDENKAIVKTIIAMAKQLDLKVIAEGVEGVEEYHFLSENSCDYAQGYGISRPLPATDFESKWLAIGD
ncbi:EAL domain-containing protein [Psychrobacillus sp. OK032]|uniref:sensor domain-containing protein n=1 Tax=Psychrobacillus sp. OK032 TaxID=1884358 RepID=UPI0008B26B1F|nr:EAL domain-containing protein [Psychrobacillus sp. OK032]SER70374.1 PAS domain S-box-containing protein/diguanylate cyclase (GGDEF) domain-containing protein [Psychrobacillus sp. OK032]